MAVFSALAMTVGSFLGEAALGAVIGEFAASAIGAGIAMGMTAPIRGQSFEEGFKIGATSSVVGSIAGAAAGKLGQSASQESMLASQEAGFSSEDLSSWQGSGFESTASASASTNLEGTGFQTTPLEGIGPVQEEQMLPLDTPNALGDVSQQSQNALLTDSSFGDYYMDNMGAVGPTETAYPSYANQGVVPDFTSDLGSPVEYDPYTPAASTPSAPTQLADIGQSAAPTSTPSLEGIASQTQPHVTDMSSTPVKSNQSLKDIFGRAKSSFKANPNAWMQGMGSAMEMYSQNQAEQAYRKQAREFQNALNNPQIGFNNWMQGGGGDYLRQNAAKMAAQGRTGVGPALTTGAMQSWYQHGQPQYMQGLQNLYGLQRNAINTRYSKHNAPFYALSSIFNPTKEAK